MAPTPAPERPWWASRSVLFLAVVMVSVAAQVVGLEALPVELLLELLA